MKSDGPTYQSLVLQTIAISQRPKHRISLISQAILKNISFGNCDMMYIYVQSIHDDGLKKRKTRKQRFEMCPCMLTEFFKGVLYDEIWYMKLASFTEIVFFETRKFEMLHQFKFFLHEKPELGIENKY